MIWVLWSLWMACTCCVPLGSPLWIAERAGGALWRVEEDPLQPSGWRAREQVSGLPSALFLEYSEGLWIGSRSGEQIEVRFASPGRCHAQGAVAWSSLPTVSFRGAFRAAARRRGGGVHILTDEGVVASVQRAAQTLVCRELGRIADAFCLVEGAVGELWLGTASGTLWRLRREGSGRSRSSLVMRAGARAIEALVSDHRGDGVWGILSSPAPACFHVDARGSLAFSCTLPFESSDLAVGPRRIWVASRNEPFIASRGRGGASAGWSARRVEAGDLEQILLQPGGVLVLAARTRVLVLNARRPWSWVGGPGIALASAAPDGG